MFLPLAQRLASRYRNSGEPLDDLQQVATVGLINSIDRYDPDAGPFVRYAVPSILGELKRHFRDKALGDPRAALAAGAHARGQPRRSTSCHRELGRTPTPKDVAEATGLQPRGGARGDGRLERVYATPLDAPMGTDEEGARTLADTLGAEDDGYELVELGNTWRRRSARLPEREQMILKLRFVDDLTQAEIAERVGVSQMHVSRLLRRSLIELSATPRDSAVASSAQASSSRRKPSNSRRWPSSSREDRDHHVLRHRVAALAELDDLVVVLDRPALGLDHAAHHVQHVGLSLGRLEVGLLRGEVERAGNHAVQLLDPLAELLRVPELLLDVGLQVLRRSRARSRRRG